ncbi:hypothetical protein NPIL_307441 [Nephila pilipes]|uniref:Uncharacterized protein n=1 Tax=Nephila pilipes TaxID=299642 RepID=A0A8X6K562_NEPPI|nr:hypothetical protein NPIL_307441 [Nephila pilipes]
MHPTTLRHIYCLKDGDDTIIFLMALNNFMALERRVRKSPLKPKRKKRQRITDGYRKRERDKAGRPPFNLGGWRSRSTPDQTDEQQIL